MNCSSIGYISVTIVHKLIIVLLALPYINRKELATLLWNGSAIKDDVDLSFGIN